MKRRRYNAEAIVHRSVVQHLKLRGVAGLVWLHPPNGGARRPIEAAIFRGLGVRAGAADLLLWHRGHSYALELKAANGKPTAAQMAFISDFVAAGGTATIATGIDEAIGFLERHGLLRGVAS